MKGNAELRNLAWKRLWADKWFGRLFGGGLLLGLCSSAVNVVLTGILGRLNVRDWEAYVMAVAQNWQNQTTPVPNLTDDFIFQATSSTCLKLFFSWIMAGIVAYGASVILLRCLKNEEEGWLGAAFGGFRDPFGMFWLLVRSLLIYFGWMILGLVPLGVVVALCVPVLKPMFDTAPLQASVLATLAFSVGFSGFLAVVCIPFYRYRFLWLVKAEHPDWGAGACIAFCRKLMKGNMMKSFRLDCSYWKPITLVLLVLLIAMASASLIALMKDSVMGELLLGLVVALAFFVSFAASLVLGQYISVGQGFFYQDLLSERTNGQQEREG